MSRQLRQESGAGYLRRLNMATMDEATRKELAEFVEREQSTARVQSAIHNFTSMCWDKCITGTPGTQFSRSESACLANCVERFLDTSLFMVQRLENIRNEGR